MSDATPGVGSDAGRTPSPASAATATAAAGGVPRLNSAGVPGAGGSRAPGPRRGARRRGRRWRVAFFALAAFAIVAGVGWALLGDRLLVVRSVTVTGTHLVGSSRVIAAADVPPGTPLLRVDTGAVARRVEAIPQVASARVTKDWPDHLVIAVTERVPVLAVKMAGGGYDLVDPTGVPVRWAKNRPVALPQLLTSLPGSALAGAPSVSAAAAVLAELQRWLAGQVVQMSVTQPTGSGDPASQQVTLHLRTGKTVLWGGPGLAGQKNRELAILLPGKARYVDVSAPGTVVTR
ncbi:FtsQ-type POTRA domain-containing protein [Trebonia kvetii]|uniref:FtsQ-type POTRA domain-containing protein n=1 Tax=Trebonia kvetii TaxID=2480626 RepID=A0A6P2BYD0_9ACTN|nr:FtsQ-type POTRA domain-containing protein [Trebonia kvetii]TVZ03195.1 FtsQ-type POTRA domain-containing protein [Trebonia kvetii]